MREAVRRLLGEKRPDRRGEVRLDCPFEDHGKSEEPFSVNTRTGKAQCFACGRKFPTLTALAVALEQVSPEEDSAVPDSEPTGNREVPGTILTAEWFWSARGYDPAGPEGVDWGEVEHDGIPFIRIYGHGGLDNFQDRNLTDAGKRYWLPPGGVDLLYFGDSDAPEAWVGEGPMDALALWSAGAPLAVAGLGADGAASEALAFRLRPSRTVFLALDQDLAGYQAAQKARATLPRFGHRVVPLEWDTHKDPGEWWAEDEEGFTAWVRRTREQYSGSDAPYVRALARGERGDLPVYPTGLDRLDALLNGGYRPGIHLLAAEPKAGKSALVQHLARTWAAAGLRVLQNSTELPKRQVWARIAAPLVGEPWTALEDRPDLLAPAMDRGLEDLAKNLRVVNGFTAAEMEHAMQDRDVLLLDYVQAMDEVQDDPRLGVNKLLRALTRLSVEQGKVIIAVSEFGRHAYRKDQRGNRPRIDVSAYKETGRLEYAVQSALHLVRAEGSRVVEGHLAMNTRGKSGRIFLLSDLGMNTFEDYDGDVSGE